jgi:hypothetical protein
LNIWDRSGFHNPEAEKKISGAFNTSIVYVCRTENVIMATVIVTGGTGLIGRALTTTLVAEGFEVIVFTRRLPVVHHPATKYSSVSFVHWNVEQGTIDRDSIAMADHIVHLAGANVGDKRWTARRKREIVNSRVKGGELLVKALREIPNKVQSVLSASGIGWYGPDTITSSQKGFTESDPPSHDFLGSTCRLWEESLEPVESLGKRLVIFRQGLVLSNDGGAFTKFKRPLRFGIAPILGSGRQRLSWIHIEDLCRLYAWALKNDMKGVYNAVAPNVTTNKHFTLQLGRSLRGRFFIPVFAPSFLLKMVFGELSIEVLKSATVSGERIRAAGFQFLYASIEAAFDNLISSPE